MPREPTSPGRGDRPSHPEISFLVGDSLPLQQAQKFLLEKRLAMVLFLILDVVRHRAHLDSADRECKGRVFVAHRVLRCVAPAGAVCLCARISTAYAVGYK